MEQRVLGRTGLVLAVAGVCAAVMLLPAHGVAASVAHRIATRLGHVPARATATSRGRATAAMQEGQPFGGVMAVGALFTETSRGLGRHFCTASVVHSPGGDLAVTAAHCVTGAAGTIVFVPGYSGGTAPYGIWRVTHVYTDAAWQASQDPDDDVAFLRLSSAAGGVPIEDVTGAEQLGTGRPAPALVRVIGYPDDTSQPVWCVNWADSFGPAQLEFDCGGYPDGTSGGPFLTSVSASSGQGTVIGVIGGYEQGGDTPSVSYSIVFGANVASLFRAAEAGG